MDISLGTCDNVPNIMLFTHGVACQHALFEEHYNFKAQLAVLITNTPLPPLITEEVHLLWLISQTPSTHTTCTQHGRVLLLFMLD